MSPSDLRVPDDGPSLIVGVGASAGGLEACKDLLEAVPPESGLAFIIVMHLDPTRSSQVAEILQRSAPHLSVVQAQGRVKLESNSVYVIAPNSKLRLDDGHVDTEQLGEDESRGGLVDHLFMSLARTAGPAAAGVVLSGAGHDGTEGLKRIHAAGGLTLAQEPSTAGSEGMPGSAAASGAADALMVPGEMPEALVAFARDGRRPTGKDGESGPRSVPSPDGFQAILDRLTAVADIDFVDYKVGTLKRRSERRMALLGIDGWDEYAALLATNPGELDALYQDVLVGVTQFFRNPSEWDRLAEEVRVLVDRRQQSGIRAWVAGCATGEEAYTLAILLHEALPSDERRQIRIYATDVNKAALSAARRGVYPSASIDHVPATWRDRFFVPSGGQSQIVGEVRDHVTFAEHNVLRDPPFSGIDVVTCRNLLIYLDRPAHDLVLERFHFALRAGGLLLLGRAETLGRQADLYTEVADSSSLFRALDVGGSPRFDVRPRSHRSRRHGGAATDSDTVMPVVDHLGYARPERRLERFLLRERTSPCVAIDGSLHIRQFYGRTDLYLRPPTGESRQDLMAWIRPDVHLRLRSALKEAMERPEPTVVDGHADRDGHVARVRCTIEKLPASVWVDGRWLVSFRELGDSAVTKVEVEEAQEPLVRELEQELSDARRELQSAIEHLESIGEEHDASHEELLSLNEELQSSNEELEASKEELEAVGEEMRTINRELEETNEDLRIANADLANLFASTGIPTVFLDEELAVRRFTTAATDILSLVPTDVGRAIEHVRERCRPADTAQVSRRVLDTGQSTTQEVVRDDGQVYRRVVSPFWLEGTTAGVCVTFLDVTEQKRALRESENARQYAEAVIDVARTPILVLDEDLSIISVNRSFEELLDKDVQVGQTLAELRPPHWDMESLENLLSELFSHDAPVDDHQILLGDRTVLINGRRRGAETGFRHAVLSFEDITEQLERHQESEKRAQRLAVEARRKDEWIAMLGHELRNPISAIALGIERLRSPSGGAQQEGRIVDMMDRQVEQMVDMLDALLNVARMTSGQLHLDRRPTNLAAVARGALETLEPTAGSKGVAVEANLPPTSEVWVDGDPTRLTEVFVNLLGNGVKFTEPGGCVSLEITADTDTATIVVRDSGIGIPSELLDGVFEIFTQAPSQLGRTADHGLGLGLSIVHNIVVEHGGRVTAESAGEGEGSTFTVRLPRIPSPSPASSTPADPSSGGTRAPSRRILVVDDVVDTAESLTVLLCEKGHDARAAFDGPTALDVARDFAPEVALIDLGMPDMDGNDVARQLRAQHPDSVLIAVSGYDRERAKISVDAFDRHVSKPVDFSDLAKMVSEVTR